MSGSSSGSVFGAPGSRVELLKRQIRGPGEASFVYRDHHFQYDAVKVLPGEYYVSSEDVLITTVLGSCIAACIWDSRARAGGMNHFMLPEGDGIDGLGRYGSHAMEMLINGLIKKGARRESMQAKVFGGAHVMAGLTTLNVGERNTRFVLDYLATERIPVVSQDVLDIHPRKVCFFPVSGRAMVKRLAHSQSETLVVEERKLSAAVAARLSGGGSVDFF
jgi:chemotaxis protein CheD